MEENTKKIKYYFWIVLNLVLAGIFVNLIFFVMPAVNKFGDSFRPARTFSVSADGKTYAAPDIAAISFSVVSRGQNPVTITDENNKKINAAIEFLKSKGIDAKDIKTAGYNLYPDYRYDDKTGQSSITGYTLTQTVNVKIRNFEKVSEILGGLTPLGVNQIGGVNFTIDDPEVFLSRARGEAFQKAQAKARLMASQLGLRLGRVVDISEYGGRPPMPYYAEASKGGLGMGGDVVSAPVIEPGQEEITVSVSVTYAFE